jgi:hypothetical protein
MRAGAIRASDNRLMSSTVFFARRCGGGIGLRLNQRLHVGHRARRAIFKARR